MLINVHILQLNPLRGTTGEAKYVKVPEDLPVMALISRFFNQVDSRNWEQYLVFVNDQIPKTHQKLKRDDTVTIYIRRGL